MNDKYVIVRIGKVDGFYSERHRFIGETISNTSISIVRGGGWYAARGMVEGCYQCITFFLVQLRRIK